MAKKKDHTLYLLDGQVLVAEEFLESDKIMRIKAYEIPVTSSDPGFLFVEERDPKPPRWASFFRKHLKPQQLGQVASASAVLLIPIDEHWFAVTFGHGRNLLHSTAVVEEFGLKTTLNIVSVDKLRSIDKETFDALAEQSRQQASSETNVLDFGLDVERDLVRAVTGVPEDPELGGRLTGRDSLIVHKSMDLDELPAFLQSLYAAYDQDAYTENFPWIDNVKRIRDSALLEELDSALLTRISRGDLDGTWLAPPEILDWSQVCWFSYSKSRRVNVFTDIHWKDVLARNRKHRGKVLTKAYLSGIRVYCHNEYGNRIKWWPVYKSIHAEQDYKGQSYLLTGGRWYRISVDFVSEIHSWFDGVTVTEGRFPIYSHKGEPAYNRHVADTSAGHWALLDREIIHYGGSHSQVEFCDLLGLDGEMVHVKRYSGSRSMSHLFAQGLVSGELIKVDESFRAAVHDHVPAKHWEACGLGSDEPLTRKVTFAVIYRSRGEFKLPFFSMISLRHATNRLTGYGYTTEIARVDMDEAWGRLQTPKDQAFSN